MINKYDILQLIQLQKEGPTWDFKTVWYDDNKKANMLHDIICMSNNTDFSDAYIIIGVEEKNGKFNITGVKGNPKYSTETLTDFLSNAKFAGNIIPKVEVERIEIYSKNIDIIHVFSTVNIPYYLSETYRFGNTTVGTGIYTRSQSTNTPINRSASLNDVNLLWKKHFGVDLSPFNKFEQYLHDYQNWEKSPVGETDVYFYKLAPEYTIEIIPDENAKAKDLIHYVQMNDYSQWYHVIARFHQTRIDYCKVASMEYGYLNLGPWPYQFSIDKKSYNILCLKKDDDNYKYFDWFDNLENNSNYFTTKFLYLECFIFIEDDKELHDIVHFINDYEKDKFLNAYNATDDLINKNIYDYDLYNNQYKTVKAMKQILPDYNYFKYKQLIKNNKGA